MRTSRICFAVILFGFIGVYHHGATRDQADPSDLIFVSTRGAGGDGCNAISVFSASAGQAIHLGKLQPLSIPARLASLPDYSRIFGLSLRDTYYPEQYLYTLRSSDSGRSVWDSQQSTLYSVPSAMAGGISIMPDGETLLIATQGRRPLRDSGFRFPPFGIAKYKISEISRDPSGKERLGAPSGQLTLDSPAAEVLPTGGFQAHIVTGNMTVLTIDVRTMLETAPKIALEKYWPEENADNTRDALGGIHASISADGRYLVTNRWQAPGADINVADLISRQAWTSIASGITTTYAIDFNRGSTNSGLLAIHGLNVIAIYRFSPLVGLTELGHFNLQDNGILNYPAGDYTLGAIGWTSDGLRLVAEDNPKVSSEDPRGSQLRIFEVSGGGMNLAPKQRLMPCVFPGYYASVFDILTSNDLIFPPEAATPTPSAVTQTPPIPTTTSLTPTSTATHTSPTVTLSATVTSLPTGTPTPKPTPSNTPKPPEKIRLYVPITLVESCPPRTKFIDVVLVMDASSSMLESTDQGERKIDIATRSASIFLDGLRLRIGADRAAIITFNDSAHLLQGLTSDKGTLQKSLGNLQIHQQSRVDLAISAATEELSQKSLGPSRVPAIVVLSDGRVNPSSPGDAIRAAGIAKSRGIIVYVVGFGANRDETVLHAMATDLRRYFSAPDPKQLSAIYSDLIMKVSCPPEIFWGRR